MDANAIGSNAIIEVIIEKDEKLVACAKANFCLHHPIHPNSTTACGGVHGKTHYRLN
jgi:hypothetical protein